MFDTHSRDQLRQTYAEAWRKQSAGLPVTPLEAMIADVISLHPEYQAVVEDLDRARAFEPNAGEATHNPFLHMGLHMAIREQISIDRPPGVRQLHAQLHQRFGDVHDAEHVMMDALAETLWEAQRNGRAPDEGHYLRLARERLAKGSAS
jgi:uncharacterized protein DUF1841